MAQPAAAQAVDQAEASEQLASEPPSANAPDPMRAAIDRSMLPLSINDDDPVSSVPGPKEALRHPLQMGYMVVELTSRALAATERGDHLKAAHYYTALAKAGPDKAVGFSRACEAFQAAGEYARAAEMCQAALARAGATAQDYFRYVQVALAKPGPLNEQALADLDAVIERVQANIGSAEEGHMQVAILKCQVAVKLEDSARLAACAQAAGSWPADSPQRFAFLSLHAMQQGDLAQAQRLIDQARAAGVDPEVLTRAQATLAQKQAQQEQAQRSAAGVLSNHWPTAAAAGIGLAALIGFWMSRRRLRTRAA